MGHPDKPGGSIEAFERVGAAHDCLIEPSCRSAFDSGADLGRNGRNSATATLAQEVEHKYYPERQPFQPFGDPVAFGEWRARGDAKEAQRKRHGRRHPELEDRRGGKGHPHELEDWDPPGLEDW